MMYRGHLAHSSGRKTNSSSLVLLCNIQVLDEMPKLLEILSTKFSRCNGLILFTTVHLPGHFFSKPITTLFERDCFKKKLGCEKRIEMLNLSLSNQRKTQAVHIVQ